jgi:Kef-type K+ transport system membrane component KefB
MSFVRENAFVFVSIIAAIAAALAYAFAAFVEKSDSKDEGVAKKAALKTAVFVAVAGFAVAWFTKPETRTVAPFQET